MHQQNPVVPPQSDVHPQNPVGTHSVYMHWSTICAHTLIPGISSDILISIFSNAINWSYMFEFLFKSHSVDKPVSMYREHRLILIGAHQPQCSNRPTPSDSDPRLCVIRATGVEECNTLVWLLFSHYWPSWSWDYLWHEVLIETV